MARTLSSKHKFKFSRKLVLGVLAIAAIGVSIPVVLSMAAAPGKIVSYNGVCLENSGGRAVDTNPTVTASCVSGAKQTWQWAGDGTIRVQGYCLFASAIGYVATGDMYTARIGTCSDAKSKHWYLKANGRVVNVGTGGCLDLRPTSSASTAPTVRNCSTVEAQRWDIAGAVAQLTGTPAEHAPAPGSKRPAPTVTYDLTAAPEYTNYINTYVKPIVAQWYPAIADANLASTRPARSSFTISFDPTMEPHQNGETKLDTGNIKLNPAFFRGQIDQLPGVLIHEMGHVVQSAPDGKSNFPDWVREAKAEYFRAYVYRDFEEDAFPPNLNNAYLSLDAGDIFLRYVTQQYDVNFARTISIQAYGGTYSDNLFVQQTGRTLPQLWKEFSGQTVSATGSLKNKQTGLCLGLQGYDYDVVSGDVNTRTCSSSDQQQGFVYTGLGTEPPLRVLHTSFGNNCLTAQGTANASPVAYSNCHYGSSQIWVAGADGSLQNPASGKCLQAVGRSRASGTKVEISTCNSSTDQKWAVPSV